MDALIPTEHETERLRLHRPVEADVEALLPLFDAEVVRYLDGVVPTREDLWRGLCMWLGHWELRGFGMWTWVDKASGGVVGRGGLWYPEGWPHLEVGWMLGRAYWGHGYATEVARAALNVAWDRLEPDWVCSVIHPENRASQAVARRLGARVVESRTLRGFPVDIWRHDKPASRDRGQENGGPVRRGRLR